MARSQHPRKRRAQSDASESSHHGHAVSAARRGSNKRARLSEETETSAGSDYVDDAPRDADAAHVDDEGQAIEPEDGNNGDADDDARDMELDEIRATQAVQRKLAQQATARNTPADNGIIEEIRCTNFMCHEHLTVGLGPLINFIIGHNGSGKSAVLTAITLCLGGRATTTNRGQSLKNFIKEGKDFASLAVRIKNQGISAYKADVYGKSIIIERQFTRAGTSGFKIKDANGKVVSTKKYDLEDITDAFALQLDNPMNVLTQDMARQFLSDSSPKDKFKFYMKGTQLEALNTDYMVLTENVNAIEAAVRLKTVDLERHTKTFQAALKKVKKAEEVERISQNETRYRNEMAWARIEEEEKILEEQDSALLRLADTRKAAEDALAKESDRFDGLEQAYRDAQTEAETAQASVQPVRDELNELDHEIVDCKSKQRAKQGELRTIMESIRHKQEDIHGYKSRVQAERERQADGDGGKHAALVQQLEEANLALETADAELRTHEALLPDLEHREAQAKNEVEKARRSQTNKAKEKQEARETVRNIQDSASNWHRAYPRGVDQLLALINQESGFRDKPIGPIGRYVQLVRTEWSSILEKSFGNKLFAFIVTSKVDEERLVQLMRRLKIRLPIVIAHNREPLDVRPHEPDREILTWLRVLKIENPLVHNALVLDHSIEQVALFRRTREATNFLMQPQGRGRNVKFCYAFHEHDQRKGYMVSLTASGGAKSDPVQRWQGAPRMKGDTEARLQEETAVLHRLDEELRRAQVAVQECEMKHRERIRDLAQHAEERENLRKEHADAQERIDQTQDELNNATPVAGVIEQLEASLRSREEDLHFEQTQYQDNYNSGQELRDRAKKLEEDKRKSKDRMQGLEEDATKATVERNKMQTQRDQALRDKNRAHEHIAALDQRRGALEGERGSQQDKLQENMDQANQVCARVPVSESYGTLEKRLQKLKRDRENQEKELGGTHDDLLVAANEAKRVQQQASRETHDVRQVSKALKMSLNQRLERWRRFRSHIARRARVTFGYLLIERKFRGRLEIEHASQHLDIKVEPDITKETDAGRQSRTLSGGEKSFSTICLLLALWDAMGSPIRCLDEFDVFMDNVNRDISMKMMITAARRAVGRQFILITPQAMGNVRLEDDVKVHKMRDPERGQTALPFGRS